MRGVSFEDVPTPMQPAPARADIACFVGFIAARAGVRTPASVLQWLVERRYLLAGEGTWVTDLLDVPLLFESFEAFGALYEWERRPLDDRGASATTYLGAAVQAFFVQGGRRCYVVPVGSPQPVPTTDAFSGADGARRFLALRRQRLDALVPSRTPLPWDQGSWRGVGHAFGLPDISMICLPDLPDTVAMLREPIAPSAPPSAPYEGFVECSDDESPPEPERTLLLFGAPRTDAEGYAVWAQTLNRALQVFSSQRRVFPVPPQLIVALPLPASSLMRMEVAPGSIDGDAELLQFLSPPERWLAARPDGLEGLASPLLQLVYPWLISGSAQELPDGLAPGDGALAGLLARNALSRGSFRSAVSLPLFGVYDVGPALRHEDTSSAAGGAKGRVLRLIDRVSLVGPTPLGLRLLSDVTTISDDTAQSDEGYQRQAAAYRLVSAIMKAAVELGEDSVFEPSGEHLWTRVRERLERLLFGLWQEGALCGASVRDAFSVRCDRSTMTRDDLDNGRLIALVQFAPATTIERIRVAITLSDGLVGPAAQLTEAS